jgi:putative membrane protein
LAQLLGSPWGFSWIFPFLFIAFGGFVLWMVFGRGRNRRRWPSGGAMPETESPLEIAKRRYARGEITKEEFEEIKRNIL